VLHNAAFEGALTDGLIACGRHDEADAIVSSVLARCQRSGATWCVPELMRVRALSLAARKRTEEAIGLVVDGLEIARSQGALAWELKLGSTLVAIDDRDSARGRLREILNPPKASAHGTIVTLSPGSGRHEARRGHPIRERRQDE
jgi:hypothetical protein